ncbi:MAG: lysophospholipid acyltransferase family protein [Solirubrobacteraceae bacterium]
MPDEPSIPDPAAGDQRPLPVPVVDATPAAPEGPAEIDAAKRRELLAKVVGKGVNPVLYWAFRAIVQPVLHVYFRISRIGREDVPKRGPVIIAANHRSFFDPFVIGSMSRRPLYFVAKKELFRKPLQRWFLNSLGAFPIDRGTADGDAMDTARLLLERGDCVVIFPEGTRMRPGSLGRPRSGVGRLALQTGAPVVPVAVHGTTHVRRGWRIRPHKIIVRAGRPLTFPRVEEPSRELAKGVTDRVWPSIVAQWDSLGGHTAERGIGVDPADLRPELGPNATTGASQRPVAALPSPRADDQPEEARTAER